MESGSDLKMDETPFFFLNGEYELFAVLHRPVGEPNDMGFVFCHPILEEKLWTHRAYVSFARDLANRGHVVLRFDHFGQGDSDGDFSAASVETHLSDIEAAIARLRFEQPELKIIALLGLRMGATFAALTALRTGDVDRLVLWEPIVTGERYMQEVLRINLTGQMATHGKVIQDRKKLVERLLDGNTVNIEGYELGHTLFDQVSAVNLLKEPSAPTQDVLIVQAGRKGQPVRQELNDLCNHYQAVFATVCEDPFWREIRPFYQKANELSDVTLRWLEGEDVDKELAHG